MEWLLHRLRQAEAALERRDVGALVAGELDQSDRLAGAVAAATDQGAVPVRRLQVLRQIAAVAVLGGLRAVAGGRHARRRQRGRKRRVALQLEGGVEARHGRHRRRDRGRQLDGAVGRAKQLALGAAVGRHAHVEGMAGGRGAATERHRQQARAAKREALRTHVARHRRPAGRRRREHRAQLRNRHRPAATRAPGQVVQQVGVSGGERHHHVDRRRRWRGGHPGGAVQRRQRAPPQRLQLRRGVAGGAGSAGGQGKHQRGGEQRPREEIHHAEHSCRGSAE